MKGFENINISDITLENIGSWPPPVKIIAIAIICVAILVAGIMLDLRKQMDHLNGAEKSVSELRLKFEAKQHQAANLDAYKKQLREMQQSFGEMLRQLPSQTEVPGLLEDISNAGLASGLEFKLFAPSKEIQHDFYAELPIKMIVVGDYHQLASFVSRVATLGRIVTLHNFLIKPENEKKTNSAKRTPLPKEQLEMDITAKTYRYADSETKAE